MSAPPTPDDDATRLAELVEAHLGADPATRALLEARLEDQRAPAALHVHAQLGETHDPERWTRLFLLFQRLRRRGPWAG